VENFGEYLKRERELRNISIEEISIVTKIKKNFLEALEKDEFDKLPGETFIKGFIRAYSNCIGLNGDEAILRYMEYKEKRAKNNDKRLKNNNLSTKKSSNTYFIILMILVLSIPILFYLIYSNKKNEDKTIIPIKREIPINEGVSLKLKKEKQKQIKNKEFSIFIKAKEKTWLRVKIDNKPYFDIILKRGDTFLKKVKKLYLIIGNAGGIELFIDGKFAGNLGKSGQVVTISLPPKLPSS
jgi:transcriptional regulator with XRE-family HTH domain